MGTLTDERIEQLKRWAFMEVPTWKSLTVRYGFGVLALALAGVVYQVYPSNQGAGFIAAVALGAAHIAFQERLMESLKAASLVRKHSIQRAPEMRELEHDPEMHELGVFIEPSDRPEIMEAGFRAVVLKAYETAASKFLTALGYVALCSTPLIIGT